MRTSPTAWICHGRLAARGGAACGYANASGHWACVRCGCTRTASEAREQQEREASEARQRRASTAAPAPKRQRQRERTA